MSIVSHGAGAAVAAQAIGTSASVLTGLRVALILLELAKCPVKTKRATAREGVDVIDASAVIQTGAGGKARKREGGDSSAILCPVLRLHRTRQLSQVSPLRTLQDVVLAQDSIKAWSAFAHKAVDVVLTDGAIPAGLAGAFIYLSLAALPFESWTAFAGEAPNVVHAGASVQTRV